MTHATDAAGPAGRAAARPDCPCWCTSTATELDPHTLTLTSDGTLELIHARPLATARRARWTLELEAIERIDRDGRHLSAPAVTLYGPDDHIAAMSAEQCRHLAADLRHAADLAEELA